MKDIVINTLESFWNLCLEMSPWLIMGFFAAGLVKYFLKEEWIQKHLGKKGWQGAIAATLWGIPLPLCSCSVLPVALAFRNKGASPESTVSFLTSTPQTGVDSIFATAGILGLPVAILRVISAFLSGIFAGKFAGGLSKTLSEPSCEKEKEDEGCCSGQSEPEQKPSFLEAIHYGFWKIPKELNVVLSVGLLIGAVLTQVGTLEGVKEWFENPIKGYLIAAIMAVPLYTCSTGSIPLAVGLASMGASPGAAMVFLILGPATNIITITSILKLVGKNATSLYLIIMTITAFSTGIVADSLGLKILMEDHHAHQHGKVEWWRTSLSIILISILILTFIPLSRFKGKRKEKSGSCCSG